MLELSEKAPVKRAGLFATDSYRKANGMGNKSARTERRTSVE